MLGQPISMLIPPVLGFRLVGRAAGGHDRHRPRADRHRTPAQARRGRQVRRVLRAGPRAPDAGRPRDVGEHVPGVRRDDRHLPDRRHDARLPAADRPRRRRPWRWSRRTRRRRGSSPTRTTPDAAYNEVIELDLATVEPSLAGPKRPQDRVSLATAKAKFAAALPQMLAERKKPAAAPGGGGVRRGGRRGHRSRRGGHRGDHELHQHVEPERADRRRPAGEEGRRARPDAQAVGEDEPRARLEGGHRVPGEGRPRAVSRRSSASTSSATAARPASATAARCPRRWRPRSKSAA